MKKIPRLLPFILILFCSFRKPETAIRIVSNKGTTVLTIFPLKDDSSLYIRRESDSNNYCREEVFSGGKRILLTTFTYFHGQTSYDTYVFSNDEGKEKIVQTQESINTNYTPLKKSFPVKDSTSFEMYYYPSGRIKSCALETSFCKRYNGFEFNDDNSQYSTGNFSTELTTDTVSITENGTENLVIRRGHGRQAGEWRTYNLEHELIAIQNFD